MPHFIVEVERKVIEVVTVEVTAATHAAAQDEGVELARADDGEIIHREVEPDVIVTSKEVE